MTSYTLNLPVQLQQEAEKLAALQGISLDRFILWAVAEKVASLKQPNEDQLLGSTARGRSPFGYFGEGGIFFLIYVIVKLNNCSHHLVEVKNGKQSY
jgi:hypothetical protein